MNISGLKIGVLHVSYTEDNKVIIDKEDFFVEDDFLETHNIGREHIDYFPSKLNKLFPTYGHLTEMIKSSGFNNSTGGIMRGVYDIHLLTKKMSGVVDFCTDEYEGYSDCLIALYYRD